MFYFIFFCCCSFFCNFFLFLCFHACTRYFHVLNQPVSNRCLLCALLCCCCYESFLVSRNIFDLKRPICTHTQTCSVFLQCSKFCFVLTENGRMRKREKEKKNTTNYKNRQKSKSTSSHFTSGKSNRSNCEIMER